MRKAELARQVLVGQQPKSRSIGASSSWSGWHRHVYSLRSLGQLDVRRTRYGAFIRSPSLRIWMTDAKLLASARVPCEDCAKWQTIPLALHCLAKDPRCLDLSQCKCLNVSADGSPRTGR
jgi:hypothetical protein